MNIIGKGIIATTLVASALTSVTPAMARDNYRYRERRDNTAAIAIGAGVVGLAIGAIAASGNNNRRDRYDDRRYYRDTPRYRDSDRLYNRWNRYDDGRRYDRYRYDDRYYGRRGY